MNVSPARQYGTLGVIHPRKSANFVTAYCFNVCPPFRFKVPYVTNFGESLKIVGR